MVVGKFRDNSVGVYTVTDKIGEIYILGELVYEVARLRGERVEKFHKRASTEVSSKFGDIPKC